MDDVVAALAGAAAGLLVGPLADRVATNAPLRRPLLGAAPRSRRLAFLALATTALGAGCGLAFGLTLEGLAAAVLCWTLVAVTRTDLEHKLIPDRIVLPAAAVVLALRTIDDPGYEWALSALAAGLVLFLVVLVYPQGLGMGDVKLSALLGAGLGYLVGIGLFIGFFFAFVPAALLLVRGGRAARKETIPLGPFLALGAVAALFAGDEIWDWYRTLGR